MSNNLNSSVNPKYYQDLPDGYQNIDIASELSFNSGSAEKYIYRSCKIKKENIKGEPLLDLNKSLWYIDNEINRCNKVIYERNSLQRFIVGIVSQKPIFPIVRKMSEMGYNKKKSYSEVSDIVLVAGSTLTPLGKKALSAIVKSESNFLVTSNTIKMLKIARDSVEKQIALMEEKE